MSDFIWTDVQGNEAEELAVELSRILQPAPPKEQMAFKVAALPFMRITSYSACRYLVSRARRFFPARQWRISAA